MSQPFIGEIRMFAGNFAPAGWAFCSGQLISISDNDVLFNLIGTTYGGDGQSTFALPDLRGRLPVHTGNGFVIAETGGVETVTLTANQTPIHTHPMLASSDAANSAAPANSVLARSPQVKMFLNGNPTVAMQTKSITTIGGNQPHDNFQPYLCVNFIIALFGIFPSQN